MLHLSIINYQRKFPVAKSRLISAARKAHSILKLKHENINIVCVGTRRMKSINKRFLNHDYVTDVITFEHGDIVICLNVVSKNAKIYKQNFQQELRLYVVHGLLHLAGFKDKTDKDIKKMRQMENKILLQL